MLIKKQRGNKLYNKQNSSCSNKQMYYKQAGFLLVSKNVGRVDKNCIKVLQVIVGKISKKYPRAVIKHNFIADVPVTGKGQGSRIGKGKGPIKTHVCKVQQGRVLVELTKLPYGEVKLILRIINKYSGLQVILKGFTIAENRSYFS